MQLAKNTVQSICYQVGYGFGALIVMMSNAMHAGFEAAERRYAKI